MTRAEKYSIGIIFDIDYRVRDWQTKKFRWARANWPPFLEILLSQVEDFFLPGAGPHLGHFFDQGENFKFDFRAVFDQGAGPH